jgi:hypothetical protein
MIQRHSAPWSDLVRSGKYSSWVLHRHIAKQTLRLKLRALGLSVPRPVEAEEGDAA